MREAFEQSILDHPDDVSSYAAFADWLSEQGDPRGEFIQVQLALEDESRSTEDRAELQKREHDLLARHEREWLGALAAHLLPHKEHAWRRGFLASLRAQYLTMSFAQALAAEPAARFLRELRVFGEARYWGVREDQPPPRVAKPEGVHEHWELLELIGAPCLKNLVIFQMGDTDGEPPEDGWLDCHTYAPGLEHVVADMPRVEELHLLCKTYDIDRLFALPNLTRLRVLRLLNYGVRGNQGERERYEYPLDVLAGNPALRNLTHLLFHPHMPESHGFHYVAYPSSPEVPDDELALSFLPLSQVRALLRSPHLTRLTHLQLRLSDMGDEGVQEIIASGILARLKVLDLRHGCVTDEGARLLAECPDTRRLERLDLSRNGVTSAGLALLTAAGVKARADKPLTPSELSIRQYLFEGDCE
jgi:uncharacterized protein (TIGR02996 family)